MNSFHFHFQLHQCTPHSLPRYLPLRLRRLNTVKAEGGAGGSGAERRTARIVASRKDSVSFPIGTDNNNKLSEFFRDTAGVEALLNTRALHSYHPLSDIASAPVHSFVYRCTLYTIQFFNFEVTPVLDLRVTPGDRDCAVELVSCEFQGLELEQKDLFSATMRNYITWREDGGGGGDAAVMDFDVGLEIALEVHTKPFSLLPLSAVEKPGNLVMQGVLDRLVPLLVQQLLQDYNSWLQIQKGQIDMVSSVDE